MLTGLRTGVYAPDSDKYEPPGLDDENLIKKLETLKIVDKEGFVPGFHKKSDVVMSYATVKGKYCQNFSLKFHSCCLINQCLSGVIVSDVLGNKITCMQ